MSYINSVRRQSRLLAKRTTAAGDVHAAVTPPPVAKKGRKLRKKNRRATLMARLEQMLYGDNLPMLRRNAMLTHGVNSLA
jgi:hypothetical protein